MPRKKSHKVRNIGAVSGGILLSIILFTMFGPLENIDVFGDDTQTVQIPTNLPGLSFTTINGASENGAIFFKIKHTTYVVDNNNIILLSRESAGIQGNPNLNAFVDPSSGRTIGGFVTIPKVWIDYTTGFKPNITFDPSLIEVIVQAQLPNGSYKVVSSKSIQSLGFTYGASNTGATAEVPFGSIGITGSEIYNNLPNGPYNSNMIISLSGNLNFHYTDFPTIKMKVPLNSNLLRATYDARITNDNPVTDIDFDGISDPADQCPNLQENYNGFEDTDGCPDTPPTTQPPVNDCLATNSCPTETPTTQSSCITEPGFGTWNLPGGVCTSKIGYASGATCDIVDNGVCKNEDGSLVELTCSDTGTCGTGPGNLAETNAFVVIDVETNYQNGDKTHRAFTGDDSGIFGITLNSLLDSSTANKQTSISNMIFRTYLGSFTDELQGMKISTSDLKYAGSVNIASKDLSAGTKSGSGGTTSEAKTLTLSTGSDSQVVFKGILVSQATFSSVDIHNAVTSYSGITLVPEGSSRGLIFSVDITGTITLVGTSADATGSIDGTLSGASITWGGLTLLNEVTPKTGGSTYNSFSEAETACGGSANVKSIGSGQYQCVPGTGPSTPVCELDEHIGSIAGVPTCLPNGSTTEKEPKIGEPGVSICIDANNPGGIPCTSEYRDLWCNGTTQCEVPPTNDNDSGPGSSINNVVDDNNNDSCSDSVGFQSASLADGICINGNSNDQNGDPGDFCTTAQSCIEKQFNIDLNDPLTLGVIAIGGIAILVSYLKKDSKLSPFPASTTQFSR